MAQTVLLAATAAAANSLDDTVAGGTYVVYTLFAADGVISSNVQVPVKRKIGAVYQPETDVAGRPVFLSARNPEFSNNARPGIFSIQKGVTPESIGVYKDA